jgi:hypothetical protein
MEIGRALLIQESLLGCDPLEFLNEGQRSGLPYTTDLLRGRNPK